MSGYTKPTVEAYITLDDDLDVDTLKEELDRMTFLKEKCDDATKEHEDEIKNIKGQKTIAEKNIAMLKDKLTKLGVKVEEKPKMMTFYIEHTKEGVTNTFTEAISVHAPTSNLKVTIAYRTGINLKMQKLTVKTSGEVLLAPANTHIRNCKGLSDGATIVVSQK